jgi:DNA polymerase-3 subunit alpha (Gram-positive type)
MIIFDVEATKLPEPSIVPLPAQPFLVEFGAVKVSETMKVISKLDFFVAPGVPLPAEFIKITNITEAMIKEAKPFSHYYPVLCDFFRGEDLLIGHNLPYDVGVIAVELARLGKEQMFPWPYKHRDTLEVSQYLTGKYLKLTELYHHLTKEEPPVQEHRAMSDVKLLYHCVKILRKQGKL